MVTVFLLVPGAVVGLGPSVDFTVFSSPWTRERSERPSVVRTAGQRAALRPSGSASASQHLLRVRPGTAPPEPLLSFHFSVYQGGRWEGAGFLQEGDEAQADSPEVPGGVPALPAAPGSGVEAGAWPRGAGWRCTRARNRAVGGNCRRALK